MLADKKIVAGCICFCFKILRKRGGKASLLVYFTGAVPQVQLEPHIQIVQSQLCLSLFV
jgi:hypothetical protein